MLTLKLLSMSLTLTQAHTASTQWLLIVLINEQAASHCLIRLEVLYNMRSNLRGDT